MIANKELSNRFDVLYNNIMSDRAPGLSEYEKSVFFNKAQLETLKNKLNPKGNKYGEGFDFSSKRQLEFSELTVSEIYHFASNPNGQYNFRNWKCTDYAVNNKSDVFSIINEALDTIPKAGVESFNDLIELLTAPQSFDMDYNKDGQLSIGDLTSFIEDAIGSGLSISQQAKIKFIQLMTDALLSSGGPASIILESKYTLDSVIDEYQICDNKVVVPVNNIEYDTLTSRPFKYPPKQQAWRLIINGEPEFALSPDDVPIRYRIRYIRMPKEVDFTKTIDGENKPVCDFELPDFLADEVLQRAIELAKNAWDGNVETTRAFGERSE